MLSEFYGYTEFFKVQVNGETDANIIPARITAAHRQRFGFVSDKGEGSAVLSGGFMHDVFASGELPTTGDFVMLRWNDAGESQIVKVLERKSKFSRSNFHGHKVEYVETILEQVVAANFDYVCILQSMNRDFNQRRLERYAAASWDSGGTPLILLTKADLAEDTAAYVRMAGEAAPGAEIITVSAFTGDGLAQFAAFLKPGITAVFLGSSGVGKSSLINALAGQEVMATKAVREDDARGRHTTTHRQLIRLPNGGLVIDTPGMRELGMWDAASGLSGSFSDVEELMTQCRFNDCGHKSEPGCAVRAALADGRLSQKRWDSYMSLARENKFTADKSAFMRERAAMWKKITMSTRKKKKKH